MQVEAGELMKRLTSIVAVNHGEVIGTDNGLPWKLRTDLHLFREITTNNTVLMGRRTYDSLGQRCLPKRFNIVVSHTLNLFHPSADCKPACSIDEALYKASTAPRQYRECYVMGGASMYEQFSPFVDRYIITLVDKDIKGDTFFRQSFLGNVEDWTIKHLKSWPASSTDEVPFSMFVVESRRAADFAIERAEAIRRGQRISVAPRARRTAVISPNQEAAGERHYSLI